MTSETHSISDICIPARPGHVILPEKRTFANHQDMCSKFKGIPSVVSNKDTQNEMNKIIELYAVCKGKILIYFVQVNQSVTAIEFNINKAKFQVTHFCLYIVYPFTVPIQYFNNILHMLYIL